MTPKFELEQEVTTTYMTGDRVFVIKGINLDLQDTVEYWLQDRTGTCETFPENALRAYVKPFDPQPGEVYAVEDEDFEVKVLSRFDTSDGTPYVAYEWIYGTRILATTINVERFQNNYPKLINA